MQFKVNQPIQVKSLQQLIDNGDLIVTEYKDVYTSNDQSFIIRNDFPFFNQKGSIIKIDQEDECVPYFLDLGVWVPEYMIEAVKENDPVENQNPDPNPAQADIIINKFNGKPFGKLFMKLIKLDNKVSEFSSTTFSKLKKHELLYIARLINDHGHIIKNYANMHVDELRVACYSKVKAM